MERNSRTPCNVIGLKRNLVDGNIHGIIFNDDLDLLYFVYDWSFKKMKAFEIAEKNAIPGFAIFHGTETWFND